MSPTRRRPDTHQQVRELTSEHTHVEWIERDDGTTLIHRTAKVPALLDQLSPVALTRGGEVAGSGFGSKPTISVEAIDTLAEIDKQANRWMIDLGEEAPLDTKACVRKLYSLMPSATVPAQGAIAIDVSKWWSWARMASGWDAPPFKPNNTCPLCGERGSLRILGDDRAAYCVVCRETWDSSNLGLLAEHIRAENGEDVVNGS